MAANFMVLGAGLGTRLRPLTERLPKPLVPLGDRPLLTHTLERLAAFGARRVVVNTHHLAEAYERYVAPQEIELELRHEHELLGTAGGVAAARDAFTDGPTLVWNGDILAQVDGPALFTALSAATPLVLAIAPRPRGQGTVGLGHDRRVVRLRSESFGEEVSGGDYVGVCAMAPEVVERLPERGCLIGDVALPRLRSGGAVATASTAGGFVDLGTIDEYFAENLAWAERHGPGPGAIGAGVRARQVVVGRGARVVGEGRFERVVVWPGVTVSAPMHDAIVMAEDAVFRLEV